MTPVEIARSYLGTKWVHQGRARHGLDCVGLLIKAFAAYGIRDVTDYSRDPSGGLLERHVREQFGSPVATGTRGRPADRALLHPGDVVLMAFPHVVRHVGIVGDHPSSGLSLIHTSSDAKRVVEHALADEVLRQVRFVHRTKQPAGGVMGLYLPGPYGEPLTAVVSSRAGGYSDGGSA